MIELRPDQQADTVTGVSLLAASLDLKEYLESMECAIPGFDIPDAIWVPFCDAVDDEDAKAKHSKVACPLAATCKKNEGGCGSHCKPHEKNEGCDVGADGCPPCVPWEANAATGGSGWRLVEEAVVPDTWYMVRNGKGELPYPARLTDEGWIDAGGARYKAVYPTEFFRIEGEVRGE